MLGDIQRRSKFRSISGEMSVIIIVFGEKVIENVGEKASLVFIHKYSDRILINFRKSEDGIFSTIGEG